MTTTTTTKKKKKKQKKKKRAYGHQGESDKQSAIKQKKLKTEAGHTRPHGSIHCSLIPSACFLTPSEAEWPIHLLPTYFMPVQLSALSCLIG